MDLHRSTWEYRDDKHGVVARVTQTQLGNYDVAVIDLDTGLTVGVKRFRMEAAADAYAKKCAGQGGTQ